MRRLGSRLRYRAGITQDSADKGARSDRRYAARPQATPTTPGRPDHSCTSPNDQALLLAVARSPLRLAFRSIGTHRSRKFLSQPRPPAPAGNGVRPASAADSRRGYAAKRPRGSSVTSCTRESSPQTAAGASMSSALLDEARLGRDHLRTLNRQIPRLVSVVLVGSDQPTLLTRVGQSHRSGQPSRSPGSARAVGTASQPWC
jgi:hypothetical protein